MLGIGLGHAELSGEHPEGVGGAFEADGHIPGGAGVEGFEARPGACDGKAPGPGDFQAQGFPLRPLHRLGLDFAVPGGQELQRPAQAGGDHTAGGTLHAHLKRSVRQTLSLLIVFIFYRRFLFLWYNILSSLNRKGCFMMLI